MVNTVTNFFRGVARTVTNVVSRSYQTARQTYNRGMTYASNGVRYVGNQVTYYGNQARNWIGTKAQQAQVWYQDTREYIVQQAQATRKKAEARIRKLCEGASKVWNSTTQAVDTFVKKHEGIIKAVLGVGTIILTVIPATAPIGIALGTTLAVGSVNNAVTGKDWLTGRELGTAERVVDGVFGTIGTISGTSTIAKQAVNTGLVDEAIKLVTPSKPVPAPTPAPQSNGGSLKMDLQFFAGKGNETTTLYRSVSAEEYLDIVNSKKFNVAPGQYEGKQFGLNAEETLRFADWDKASVAVVETKIPTNILNEIADTTRVDESIFKKGTVTILEENLEVFNKSIQDIADKY